MAHFAQLDENNFVVQVIVVANAELMDGGVESEEKGIAFCQSLFPGTVWKQTSYNGKIRKNYASVGMYFNESLDMFLAPKPFPSWKLNKDVGVWEPPVPIPDDSISMYTASEYPGEGKHYVWNEQNQLWVEFVIDAPVGDETITASDAVDSTNVSATFSVGV